MALVIPNIESSPTYDGQSSIDATDLLAWVALSQKTGVISGGEVSEHTGTDRYVSVAAGTDIVEGVAYSYAATGSSPLAIAAASSTDRKDIVVYTVGTGLEVIEGTPCGTAGWTTASEGDPPAKSSFNPATQCLHGEVYVANTTTEITAGNIVDKTPTWAMNYNAAEISNSIQNISYASTVTLDLSAGYNIFRITGVTGAITIETSGTPTDEQPFWVELADNGTTPETVDFSATYFASTDQTLPTETKGTNTSGTPNRLRVAFVANIATGLADCIGSC